MIKLHTWGGLAAIALLSTMGSASAGTITVPCGATTCQLTATPFVGATPPAGFDNFGIGAIPNSRQTIGTPFSFETQTITWGTTAGVNAGTPPNGVYAGNMAGAFASPFTAPSQQEYLVAGGGGGTVTVADNVGQGNTLSLIWGTVDTDPNRNLLVSGAINAISIQGSQVLTACNITNLCVAGVTNALVTLTGLGNYMAFTASDAGAAAFEFVPQREVPEPASLALLGSALVGFGLIRRRRKSA